MPNLTTTIKFWSWCKTSTIYALFNQVLQVLTQFHCNAKATLTGNGFPWLYAQGSEAKTTVGSSVTSAGSSFAGRVQKTRSRRCLAGSWGMKWSSPVLSVVAKSQSKLQMPSWPCVDVNTYLYRFCSFRWISWPMLLHASLIAWVWYHSLKIVWEVQRGQTSWQGLQDECSSSIPAHVSSFGGHPRLWRWWEWIMMDHDGSQC